MFEAQFTASSQIEGGILYTWRRQVFISFNDLFFSQAPFCCGVYGTKCSIRIPSDSQNCWKYPLMYSPPLSFKIFESFEYLWFLLHKINPAKPWTIINKSKKIPGSIDWCCRNWSWDITMYQIKCRGSSSFLPNFLSLLRMLNYQQTKTYSIWCLDEWQALNHFIIVKLLEIFEIEMPKSLMPKFMWKLNCLWCTMEIEQDLLLA